jgi:hypothetical protein
MSPYIICHRISFLNRKDSTSSSSSSAAAAAAAMTMTTTGKHAPYILWQTDPLLGNDHETNETTVIPS